MFVPLCARHALSLPLPGFFMSKMAQPLKPCIDNVGIRVWRASLSPVAHLEFSTIKDCAVPALAVSIVFFIIFILSKNFPHSWNLWHLADSEPFLDIRDSWWPLQVQAPFQRTVCVTLSPVPSSIALCWSCYDCQTRRRKPTIGSCPSSFPCQ